MSKQNDGNNHGRHDFIHPMGQLLRFADERVCWQAFERELKRATGWAAADPRLDVVFRAVARWGEELASLRYRCQSPMMRFAAMRQARKRYPIPELDEGPDDAE